MVKTYFLLFGALVSTILASPLLPDTSTSVLQLPNVLTPITRLLNISMHATTLHANLKGKCFEQKPPTEPQWPPTNFNDCGAAITKLGTAMVKVSPTRSTRDPMVFSKDTTLGLELPQTFKSGSCAVLIDINSSKDFELMPPKDAMDAAWTLATTCVAQPGPKIGGSGILGEKKLLSITVYGVKPER